MYKLIAVFTLLILALGVSPASGAELAKDDPRAVLRAALKKTTTATAYRMELNIKVSGLMPDGSPSRTGTNVSMSLIDLKAAFSKGDSQMYLGGFFTSFLGAPANGLELKQVGGFSYIRGPVPMLGAPENRWYRAEKGKSALGDSTAGPTDARDTLKEFEQADLSWMQSLGSERLDGQSCQIYGSKDPATVVRMLKSASDDSSQTAMLAGVKSASLQVWVCDDGYLHQARLDLQGSDPRKSGSNFTIGAGMRMYDFGARIVIAAPENPLPLQAPGGADPVTPTPQPETASITATAGVAVAHGGNIRAEPNLRGKVLGQLHAGDPVQLLEKSADGTWYRMTAPDATGWVSATLLRVPAEVAARTPVTGAGSSAPAGELSATVYNGGNVRATPSVRAKVLDQIHARETVRLLGKTADGAWYSITNQRGVTGWVSRTLLTIDTNVAAKVPVVK